MPTVKGQKDSVKKRLTGRDYGGVAIRVVAQLASKEAKAATPTFQIDLNSLNAATGIHHLQIARVLSCVPPCNVGNWDTPVIGDISQDVWYKVPFTNEIQHGKAMTNSIDNGLIYRAQKNGTYTMDFYLRIKLLLANSQIMQAVLMKNGAPWRELDAVDLTDKLLFRLQGGSAIPLQVGDEIGLGIRLQNVAFENVLSAIGWLTVVYECHEHEQRNSSQIIIAV